MRLSGSEAVELLPPEIAEDQQRTARFEREAKLLAALKHPIIASIYGLEETNGTHLLVPELVPDQSCQYW